MARTTKAQTSAKRTRKSKGVEADAVFSFKNGEVIVSLYERENEKINAKITLLDSFVIYGKVVILDDSAFISYPSFKAKSGDYVSQAYCFDKELNEEINAQVTGYVFE